MVNERLKMRLPQRLKAFDSQLWGLNSDSRTHICNVAMLYMPVTVVIRGLEAGRLLELSGFQTSWENASPTFKERPWFKEIGEDWKKEPDSLFWILCMHRHAYNHTHMLRHSPVHIHKLMGEWMNLRKKVVFSSGMSLDLRKKNMI